MPGKGRPLVSVDRSIGRELEDVRFYTVNRFRSYVVYYRIEGRVLVVLRVLHGSEDRNAKLP